jgi:hypothetical protein
MLYILLSLIIAIIGTWWLAAKENLALYITLPCFFVSLLIIYVIRDHLIDLGVPTSPAALLRAEIDMFEVCVYVCMYV